MTNNIQLFNFGDNAVRVIIRDGSLYWVAKDICDILGYSSTHDTVSRLLDDDEVSTINLHDGRKGNPHLIVITESGLYSLICKSNKPLAKSFRKWVAEAVLPRLRNNLGSNQPARLTKSIMYCAKMIFEAAGIHGNQLALALDKVAHFYTGQSMLNVSGVTLISPTNNQLLSVADIAKHFGLSALRVNEILEDTGFQRKVGTGYEPLEHGEPFAVMVDSNNWSQDGSPVRQLMWDSSILQELQSIFQDAM